MDRCEEDGESFLETLMMIKVKHFELFCLTYDISAACGIIILINLTIKHVQYMNIINSFQESSETLVKANNEN